jgi:two-component system response regulator RegA
MSQNLLIVEDDKAFATRLAQTMEKRGFTVETAHTVADGKIKANDNKHDYALIDLKLEDGSGLEVVHHLQNQKSAARIVVLTGYGNIATAVAAVKAGAVDYLAKPADIEQIVAALLNKDGNLPPPPEQPMPPDRVRWEHIQRVYHQCQCNISETARRLGMHRRSLQRILQKHAPVEQKDQPMPKLKSQ